MLHVTFGKLTRCRGEDVVPGEIGFDMRERQRILQLVAEAIGSACLIEPRPRPHAA